MAISLEITICSNRDVNIYKSNGTTLVTEILCGGSYSIPTHQITDTDGTIITDEFDENFVCASIATLSCAQLNAGLTDSQRDVIHLVQPGVSGQTTSIIAGDDGDLEPGRGGSSAGFGGKFFTLSCNNEFGNLARFTSTTGQYYADPLTGLDRRNADGTVAGGAIYTNNLMIDHKERRMYSLVELATTTMAAQIAAGAASVFGGFTDWRLVNNQEFTSICLMEPLTMTVRALEYYPFLINGFSDRVIWLNNTISAGLGFQAGVRTIAGSGGGEIQISGSGNSRLGLIVRNY